MINIIVWYQCPICDYKIAVIPFMYMKGNICPRCKTASKDFGRKQKIEVKNEWHFE